MVAIVSLALAALGMAAGWIRAERRTGEARVRYEQIRAALQVVTMERDEALGDVERAQRRGDALEEFSRDQINRLGGMLDADGVDLLLAELAIVADPRGRPIDAPASAVVHDGPAAVGPAGGSPGAAGGDVGVLTGGTS